MVKALSSPRNRVTTLVLLGAAAVLTLVAAAQGISDNAPGVLTAYAAATCAVLAIAHRWRSSKEFRRLAAASVIGFVTFAVLHIPFENLAGEGSGPGADLLGALGAAFFMIATLLCPAGLVVGAVGSVVTWMRERHSGPRGRASAHPA